MKLVSRTTASVAALTVIGVGAGGIAYADSSTTTAAHHATAATAPAAHGKAGARRTRRGRHPLLARTLHGELTLRAGKGTTVTLDLQRGAVTAVSPTSLTLKSVDGVTHDYVVTSATKVRSKGKKESISDVAVGERAFVVSVKSSTGTLTARAIRGVHAPKAGAGATTTG